jgi:hypothetical protein
MGRVRMHGLGGWLGFISRASPTQWVRRCSRSFGTRGHECHSYYGGHRFVAVGCYRFDRHPSTALRAGF